MNNIGRTNRIINGTLVPSKSKYPWFCSILSQGSEICGGSYLGNNFVLTAAHCMDEELVSHITVKMGNIRINDSSVNVYKATRIVIHNNFNRDTLNNDIAIIHLNKKPSNDGFTAIRLVTKSLRSLLESKGRSVTVIGFGATQNGGEGSSRLREANIKLMDKNDPNQSIYNPNEITSRMLLAADFGGGGNADNKDSCQGDSGGPLVTLHNNVYYQLGIVSWGEGCALTKYPGVYTRLSQFVDWVSIKTNRACEDQGLGSNTEIIDDKLPLLMGRSPNQCSLDVNRGGGFMNIVSGARHACSNRYIFLGKRHSTRLKMDDRFISLMGSINGPKKNRTVNYNELVRFHNPNGNAQMRIISCTPFHVGKNSGADFTIDAGAGAGLVNLVAGAKHFNLNTYRYFGKRGSTRIRLDDDKIKFYISINNPSPGSVVKYQNPVCIKESIVTINGSLQVSGSKNFRISHPKDPTKDIVHACLEGPENAVYYRGESILQNRSRIIMLPDYFEDLVSDQGRTILLTCLNGWSPLYVENEIQNGKFVVKTTDIGDTNQKFYWEVKGVRKDIESLEVLVLKDNDRIKIDDIKE